MSDKNSESRLPPQSSAVRELIDTLRRHLRRYALLSGLLFIVSVAAAVFWVTSAADSGWFALQKLELPVGLRTIVAVLLLLTAIWLLIQHLGRPVLRHIRDSELALLLEKRFPEFQDRLITTIENPHGPPDSSALADNMLQRTVRQADSVAAQVAPDDVFNFLPLKKRGVMAALLVLSVAGSAVARPGSLGRWWDAFVLRRDVYHERTSLLNIAVVAQPDSRLVDFRETEAGPLYLHPRGADLELEMTVPEGTSPTGQPWIVPERARVDVTRFDGSRSRTYVTPSGNRVFRFVLTRLQETVSIEVLAGDYRTPVPLLIESVTPPDTDAMEAVCEYPEYTGWNQVRESVVPILSSEFSLPVGTRFRLNVASNKPLQAVRIESDRFELSGNSDSSKVVWHDSEDSGANLQQPLLSDDGLHFGAEFQVVLPAGDSAEQPESVGKQDNSVLPIPSNTSLRFVLHDQDGIISASPESLRIRGIPDKAPVIATRTSGVGNAITRRAVIPVTGLVRDDYGLATAGFQFIVDDETQWRPRPFRNPIAANTIEHELVTESTDRPERFDVQPLELTEGQILALAVIATDNCSIPEANVARAEPIVFRIVSNEELLSLLYTRELNLRRRFEEVIRQLEQIRDDLQLHEDIARRLENAEPQNANPDDRAGLTACARRSGDSLRRQNNELESIAESFDDIVLELLNNAVPPRQVADNMRVNIVAPLQQASSEIMAQADRSLSRFRVAALSGTATRQLVTQSVQDVTEAISQLKLILENVRDMAEFHELYQEGKLIYEELLKIWEETRELQKKRAIEKLKLFE